MLEKLTHSFKNSTFNHCHMLECLLKCKVYKKEACPSEEEHLQLREISSQMLVLQMVE